MTGTLGIVVSRADAASVTIGEQLRECIDWERITDDSRPDGAGGGTVYRAPGIELREFDELHLDLTNVAKAFTDPRLVAFVSKHAGDTGRLLTAHHTGNFGPAEAGGEDGEFATACPNAHSEVLASLAEYAPANYEVGMECTHHGPTAVGVPSMFVELGSSESEWSDPAGARAVARAVIDLRDVAPRRERQLVGFGGGHYVPRFERIVGKTDWAVGHIGADWALDAMGSVDEDVLRRAFERSGANRALVEGERPELERTVERLGYELVGETWLRETTGVPLDVVAEAEERLTTIEQGLRFGAPATEGGIEDAERWRLPGDLLAEAEGIDAAAVRETVEHRALAFETEQSGTRIGGRALVNEAGREAILDALVALLGEKYHDVEREDGRVVVHETAFSPERAHEMGVPEGPAFGRLADGESVTVDGRAIDPEIVHVECERRFSFDGCVERKGKDK
ncbi:D-aminoacyl-tRNA deacylase [Halococcus sediminicola]|uniref:D-aminoacyl-tRNA deacylase n=1 Tax=Halococcus sediminicola TaxID=1264579 RepID=UPI0006785DC7|nr:D-aminoacyl-tRNA deacylase [Halococcus sediminicola]